MWLCDYRISLHFYSYCLSASVKAVCLYEKTNNSLVKVQNHEADRQISAKARIRGIAFHQFTRYRVSALCSPEDSPLLCIKDRAERATKHQNRKMQKWGREKERRREREGGRRGLSQLLLGSVSSDRRLLAVLPVLYANCQKTWLPWDMRGECWCVCKTERAIVS